MVTGGQAEPTPSRYLRGTWQARSPPSGKARRKASPQGYGYKKMEQANASR